MNHTVTGDIDDPVFVSRVEAEIVYVWNRNSFIDTVSPELRFDRWSRVFDRLMGLYKGIACCHPDLQSDIAADILMLCELVFVIRGKRP